MVWKLFRNYKKKNIYMKYLNINNFIYILININKIKKIK